MKSGKQRRIEIKEKRRRKADSFSSVDRFDLSSRPANSVLTNQGELLHNPKFDYLPIPLFYVDMSFICKDCESQELWTAKQQKWWYEIAKGDIDSVAVRCRGCRKKERARKAEARSVHLEGLAKKVGL